MNFDLEYLHLFQRNKFILWRFSSPLINPVKAIIGLNTAFEAYFSVLVSRKLNTYRGRKTEIDFLNGKISDLGRKHGVDTPANDVMVAFIRFMEGRRWTLKD